jgi:MFS family permease
LRFIFTDAQFSFVAVAMTTGTFAAGCFSALASLYVRDVVRADVSVFGVMGSLIGVGTIVGSALVSRLAKGREPTQFISAGVAIVGASIFLIAARPLRIVAWTGAAGIGFGVAMVMLGCTVMLQGKTPSELRGRVSGATGALASFAQLAAMMFAGTWAGWFGIRGVFFCSAALLLMVAARTAFTKPRSLNLSEADGALLREDAA